MQANDMMIWKESGGRAAMDFRKKYELLEALPGQEIKSFKAREIASGRSVLVHLLSPAQSTAMESILRHLADLPAERRKEIVEVGNSAGTPYVVTDMQSGCLPLGEWLNLDKPVEAEQFGRPGAGNIPAKPDSEAPARVETEAGESTRMFLSPPFVDERPASTPSPPPAEEPGEFTRMFFGPGRAPEPIAEAAAPPAKVPPEHQPPTGEFTRVFRPPAPFRQSDPEEEPTVEIPIARPAPISETPASAPALPAQPAARGEFTEAFEVPPQAAPAPSHPAPLSLPLAASDTSSEFAKVFDTPLQAGTFPPPPAPAPAGRTSEFSEMLRSPTPPAPSVGPLSPPLASVDSGEFAS